MNSRLYLLSGLAFTLGVCIAGEGEDNNSRVRIIPRIAAGKGALPRVIRADVGLVQIPVTVTDALGTPLTGLPRHEFRLFENGVEQEVKYFTSEDAPVSLGIVFDASKSMTDKIDQSRSAVVRLFTTSIPGDEYFLVEFNDSARVLCNFTSNQALIENAVLGITPKNWTALFDAVYLSIQQSRRARNSHKALLILSDGADNYSRYTESELKSLVREADVNIYSIGIVGRGLINRHARVLKQLSETTGGQYYQVSNPNDIADAVTKISDTIRAQYVLGYSSNNPRSDGLYRKVEVRLNERPGQPRLRASWRMGYYSPDR